MIGIDKINEIVNKIAGFYDPDKIILFGSYAYGIPTENSDLDLLIIKDSVEPRPDRTMQILKMLYGSMIPMDLIVYTNNEIKESLRKSIPLFIMQLLMARFYMNATQNEITITFCKVNLKIEFHTTEIF